METKKNKIPFRDEVLGTMEYPVFSSRHRGISEAEYKVRMEQLTDKDVTVFDELGALPAANIHSETYATILCLAGKASCKIEGKEYNIGKNDIVMAHPNQLIENTMVSCDFKCRGILMSPSYFESIFILGGNIWEAGLIIRENPLLHLEDQDMVHFLNDYEFLKQKLADTHLPHHAQIIKLLLQSFIFEFYDNLAPMLNQPLPDRNYSSAEIIFKRFVTLASTETPRHHDVAHYANKLCITPKYLSAICKKQTGKTASDLLHQVTLNYIRTMLTSSEKSIKEIAVEAGFDNLSFFGKYVRRGLGMSPREYRAKRA